MLRREALSALPQSRNVPAPLGLFRRFQRQFHAASQMSPQPRKQLSPQRLCQVMLLLFAGASCTSIGKLWALRTD